MNNKDKLDREKITEILGEVLDKFTNEKIPIDLDRRIKSILVNKGYCADFALAGLNAILYQKHMLNYDVDIKIYNWSTLHTFLVIDGYLYDAQYLCGIQFKVEKKMEYFVSLAIESALVMDEYIGLVSKHNDLALRMISCGRVKALHRDFNKKQLKDNVVTETIYTPEEFLEYMLNKKKG